MVMMMSGAAVMPMSMTVMVMVMVVMAVLRCAVELLSMLQNPIYSPIHIGKALSSRQEHLHCLTAARGGACNDWLVTLCILSICIGAHLGEQRPLRQT